MADAKPNNPKAAVKKKKAPASQEGRAFLEALVNAEARNSIWRNVSILMAGLVMVLLYSMIRMGQTVPVRLIPYEVATGMQAMEVGPNGENAKEYLGHIAEADLALFTNWRSDTVGKRFGGLSKRMTPGLLARQQQSLREEATKFERSRYQQVFHPKAVQALSGSKIRIVGSLQRWSGEIEVLNTNLTYILSYTWFSGMPLLDGIEVEGARGNPNVEDGAQ